MDPSATHPLYDSAAPHWQEALDFYRSGHWVTQPGRHVGNAVFSLPLDANADGSATTSDSSRGRNRSRFESVPLQSYLYSHVRESYNEYGDRCARADHYPLFRKIVDIYVSAALRLEPTRPEDADPVWRAYWADTDLRGTDIAAFVRQALTYALVYGQYFAVTDKPRFTAPAASRGEQLARGERAYTYLVSPLDVLNWQVDEVGRLNWIVIREAAPDTRKPGDEYREEYQYRIRYRDHWELWAAKKRGGKMALQDEGATPGGEVTVAILEARRGPERSLVGDSMLAGLVRNDRSIFNRLSLLDEILYKQAYAQLFVPVDDSGPPTALDVGISVAVGFNGANGAPMMLSPDASLLLALWKIICDEMQLVRDTYDVGRGKAEYSKEERSAEALSVESRHENNRVASLAECCEEFDRTIHRHVALWEGKSDWPLAEYSRDVSLRTTSQQIQDATQLKALGVPWDVLKEIAKPLVAASMKAQGRPRDDIDAALRTLMEAKPDAPALPALSAGNRFGRDEGDDGAAADD